MAVESIGTVATDGATQLRRVGLEQEDFLRILLAQLSFQDPMKPMDNQEFIAQMAQFTALEQTRQSNDKIDALLTLQSADQSVSLLGRTVEARTAAGSQLGEVTTVRFEQGSPLLTVRIEDDEFITDLRPSQITVVR